MNGQSRAIILGLAAVTLVACASIRPVSSTGTEPDAAGAQVGNATEYQSLVDNANSGVVCRREFVTGSRIQREVCVTLADRELAHERSLALMREIQTKASAMPQTMPGRPAVATAIPPARR
jgi:hypothetical protein